ncbi:phage baseplate protein [Natroniella sp. ANB-PHB2]|uniref:phage baseplate protein n=1 Tax=Natroniella sp. ANB-PHB2 TaxID=3384444 RepID=UPI0038D4A5BF
MGQYGDIEFNIIREENLTLDNNITQHPIEDQVDISDHIENEPTRLSVDITVVGEEAEEIKEELKAVARSKEPQDYFGVEQIEPYENMVIVSLDITTNSEVSNGFRASMTLQQVRLVEADTIEVDLGPDPVTGTQPQEGEGEVEVRDPESDDVDEETVSSILNDLLAQFGGDDDAA